MGKNIPYHSAERELLSLRELLKDEQFNCVSEHIEKNLEEEFSYENIALPSTAFQVVEQGFLESYFAIYNQFQGWFGGKEIVETDDNDIFQDDDFIRFHQQVKKVAENSPVYSSLKLIKDYAFTGRYDRILEEPADWDEEEYRRLLKDDSSKYLPFLELLHDAVLQVYDFWKAAESYDRDKFQEGHRSIFRRYFTLFALSAWHRMRIDFGIEGDLSLYVKPSENEKRANGAFKESEEVIFTCGEIAMLCGEKYRNITGRCKILGLGNKPIKKHGMELRLPKTSNGYKTDCYREVDEYFKTGLAINSPPTILTLKEARRLLRDRAKHGTYKHSDFSLS